jgi:Putative collagen-binding domain of a collagenase
MDSDGEREQVRRGMGQTRRYAQRMNLAASRPRPDLASTRFCLAVPGREYLVYQPRAGAFSVDLRAAPASFRVEWFQPSTGRRWYSRVSGGHRRTMTPPVGTPVVLYLRRA